VVVLWESAVRYQVAVVDVVAAADCDSSLSLADWKMMMMSVTF